LESVAPEPKPLPVVGEDSTAPLEDSTALGAASTALPRSAPLEPLSPREPCAIAVPDRARTSAAVVAIVLADFIKMNSSIGATSQGQPIAPRLVPVGVLCGQTTERKCNSSIHCRGVRSPNNQYGDSHLGQKSSARPANTFAARFRTYFFHTPYKTELAKFARAFGLGNS
jgi:hypothetical protein